MTITPSVSAGRRVGQLPGQLTMRMQSKDPNDRIEHLVRLDRPLTVEDIESAIARCGWSFAPRITYFAVLYAKHPVPREVIAHVVPSAWCSAEFPQLVLTQSDWRALFKAASYTENGVGADRPLSNLTLYRGSGKAHRRRWSWTSDRIVAEKFAEMRSLQHGATGAGVVSQIWTAEVEPWRLFAFISGQDFGRSESEYVIDTKGLAIAPVAHADRCRGGDRVTAVDGLKPEGC